jgi:hypothetical protein
VYAIMYVFPPANTATPTHTPFVYSPRQLQDALTASATAGMVAL